MARFPVIFQVGMLIVQRFDSASCRTVRDNVNTASRLDLAIEFDPFVFAERSAKPNSLNAPADDFNSLRTEREIDEQATA